MKAVIQRVASAHVEVSGDVTGSVERGLLVYLGVAADDDESDVAWTADKIATLRIFPDDAGKMSRSVEDIRGGVLVVSQFTLFADVRKGRRPSFDGAAPPDKAERLYEDLCKLLRDRGLPVGTGRFRAMMDVISTGSGPVTILADSRKT